MGRAFNLQQLSWEQKITVSRDIGTHQRFHDSQFTVAGNPWMFAKGSKKGSHKPVISELTCDPHVESRLLAAWRMDKSC
jgi:hypothetical protein